MLAQQKWQIKTIQALELVFAERLAQYDKHGEAMRSLPDGIGPETTWLEAVAYEAPLDAVSIERELRRAYEKASERGTLTRCQLVLEELAEAFAEEGDSDEFLAELVQTTALLVQWLEYKLESRTL